MQIFVTGILADPGSACVCLALNRDFPSRVAGLDPDLTGEEKLDGAFSHCYPLHTLCYCFSLFSCQGTGTWLAYSLWSDACIAAPF